MNWEKILKGLRWIAFIGLIILGSVFIIIAFTTDGNNTYAKIGLVVFGITWIMLGISIFFLILKEEK